ncbi:hypothetical protein P7K49_001640 [Saguinus oedipus]|uniref:Uncharacterized protein n=1 Tax=Saguinus oedipus TaxID=9490 RepID=A0ABQ9WF21_SAGOE|nr:hypothetical protein P7K49_001640 [Saguinus oedipus]
MGNVPLSPRRPSIMTPVCETGFVMLSLRGRSRGFEISSSPKLRRLAWSSAVRRRSARRGRGLGPRGRSTVCRFSAMLSETQSHSPVPVGEAKAAGNALRSKGHKTRVAAPPRSRSRPPGESANQRPGQRRTHLPLPALRSLQHSCFAVTSRSG